MQPIQVIQASSGAHETWLDSVYESGVVLRTIDGESSRSAHVTWETMRAAAHQDDAHLSAIYRAILGAAEDRLHEHRVERASTCDHAIKRTETRPFTGPVGDPEEQNQVAHGGVTYRDHCSRCGAVRDTNANGGQSEVGAWGIVR